MTPTLPARLLRAFDLAGVIVVPRDAISTGPRLVAAWRREFPEVTAEVPISALRALEERIDAAILDSADRGPGMAREPMLGDGKRGGASPRR